MFSIWWKQNENCYKKKIVTCQSLSKNYGSIYPKAYFTESHKITEPTHRHPLLHHPLWRQDRIRRPCDKLNVKIPGTRIQSSSGALAWCVLEPSFHSQQHEKKKKIWGSEEAQQWGRGCQAVTKNAYAHMEASCESFPHISWEETCPHKTQEMTPTLSRNFYTWISKAMWAAGGTSRSPLPSSSQRPPTSPCF